MRVDGRRGVSLMEMLVALTISVGIGAAILSLLLTSIRFSERNEAQRSARLTGQSAINALVNDLRLVDPSWGIEAASATAVQVKSPYALGIVCDTTGQLSVVILPVDSTSFAAPGYSGFAWRSSGGTYTAIAGGTMTTSAGSPPSCAAAGVQVFPAPAGAPNQKTINVVIGGTSRSGIGIGTVVMLYRRARFFFAASAQDGLTDRTALWRDYLDDNGAAAELIAPFDASAGFGFYLAGSGLAQGTAPGTLSTIRGLQLRLPGESDRILPHRTTPEQVDMTTAVFFLNAAS